MQTYTDLPSHFGEKWTGCKVFHVCLEVDGEECNFYHRTRFTRRTLRQMRRDLRNYTLAVFDDMMPDPLAPNMHRMKGARQAYARRAKNV